MAREKIIVGIDVGSSKITTLIASSSREEEVTVIGVSTASSRGLRKGQVVDIEEAVSAISESVESAERMGGVSISSAFVSVGGAHIASINSHGVVAVAGGENEISEEDVRRVTEAARAISIPSSREIIHVVPRDFIVDSQEGIKDPIGMTGVRLEVETHIISGAATSLRNLVKCVQQVGIDVEGLVFSGVAASEATLTDTEKELGVALIDIGGGTTDVALFVEGSIAHSVVIPIGGRNITNDLAIGLRSSLESAEKIKLELANQSKKPGDDDEEGKSRKDDVLDVSKLGLVEDLGILSKKTLTDGIIKPRLTEIFTLIGMEIKRSGYAGLLPAGLVVTGGAAETLGLSSVGKEVLRMPVRIASPLGVTGLIDEISSPAYAASVGLLIYGNKITTVASGGVTVPIVRGKNLIESAKKLVNWLKSFLP
ncbi:MAG: cell division protein FtsA [Candidatus Woykebacteria bacterium RIFCSPHIGHO2_12_FULL_45_10]|uniref:Cell division protein FtsA n=1 Tax=Candidatus Woykebacteria bacterium RIFCSPHIGHO2_12_FULL_45_10 TaxID=1802603 RepID=A0A1G1WR81_9BACT|nr:MAG: cell division protein FtsA [Candidatus Woykebacteria bacterium RIFCSPHIGHO2_12_FULL_45_10]